MSWLILTLLSLAAPAFASDVYLTFYGAGTGEWVRLTLEPPPGPEALTFDASAVKRALRAVNVGVNRGLRPRTVVDARIPVDGVLLIDLDDGGRLALRFGAEQLPTLRVLGAEHLRLLYARFDGRKDVHLLIDEFSVHLGMPYSTIDTLARIPGLRVLPEQPRLMSLARAYECEGLINDDPKYRYEGPPWTFD